MPTKTLTGRQEIRDWAATLMGAPAIVDTSPESGVQPMLRIVFGQASYQDQDRPERPPNAGGYELVEWDEWLDLFEKHELALVVDAAPGPANSWYEIVKRSDAD